MAHGQNDERSGNRNMKLADNAGTGDASSTGSVAFLSFVAALGGVLFGYDTAVINGGEQQIASRVSYNEIDVLLYFRDTRPGSPRLAVENELLRMCDLNNIPVATNIATAEAIITALERGDYDWREFVK